MSDSWSWSWSGFAETLQDWQRFDLVPQRYSLSANGYGAPIPILVRAGRFARAIIQGGITN